MSAGIRDNAGFYMYHSLPCLAPTRLIFTVHSKRFPAFCFPVMWCCGVWWKVCVVPAKPMAKTGPKYGNMKKWFLPLRLMPHSKWLSHDYPHERINSGLRASAGHHRNAFVLVRACHSRKDPSPSQDSWFPPDPVVSSIQTLTTVMLKCWEALSRIWLQTRVPRPPDL